MSHLPTPPDDNPEMQEAAYLWDDVLLDGERRHVWLSVYRCVLGWRRTGNVEYLTGLGLSIDSMVILERNQPGAHERIRNGPRTIEEAGGAVSIDEARALLRLGSTAV